MQKSIKKSKKKTQKQTKKTTLKIIAKVNKKTEKQINKKINKEIKIQHLKSFMFQINDVFYSFEFIFVFSLTKVLIQKDNDTKNTIIMIMKIVLKIENLKFVEEILIFAFVASIVEMFFTFVVEKIFYERKQILLFCFMIYVFFSLFFMNTSFDLNFNIFDIESINFNVKIKSSAISMFKKKMFLSSFKNLTLRQNSNN